MREYAKQALKEIILRCEGKPLLTTAHCLTSLMFSFTWPQYFCEEKEKNKPIMGLKDGKVKSSGKN